MCHIVGISIKKLKLVKFLDPRLSTTYLHIINFLPLQIFADFGYDSDIIGVHLKIQFLQIYIINQMPHT